MIIENKKLYISLVVGTMFVIGGYLFSSNKSLPDSLNILVIGDSLSASHNISQEAGWVNLMLNSLLDKGVVANITNLSVSGATSGNMLTKITNINNTNKSDLQNMDLIIIAIGANDALQRLNSKTMVNNIEKILDITLKNSPNASVLFANVDKPSTIILPISFAEYRTDYKLYVNKFKEDNKITNVIYIDNLLDGLNKNMFLADKVHPNELGQKEINKTILNSIF